MSHVHKARKFAQKQPGKTAAARGIALAAAIEGARLTDALCWHPRIIESLLTTQNNVKKISPTSKRRTKMQVPSTCLDLTQQLRGPAFSDEDSDEAAIAPLAAGRDDVRARMPKISSKPSRTAVTKAVKPSPTASSGFGAGSMTPQSRMQRSLVSSLPGVALAHRTQAKLAWKYFRAPCSTTPHQTCVQNCSMDVHGQVELAQSFWQCI